MSEINPYESPQSELSPNEQAATSVYSPHQRKILVAVGCQVLAIVMAFVLGYREHPAAIVMVIVYFVMTVSLTIMTIYLQAHLLFYLEVIVLFVSLGVFSRIVFEIPGRL